MPMYTNIGGGQRQLVSIYINKNGTRKALSYAYANINGTNKEIFAPLYGWIKYTYYGSNTRETYPYLNTFSSENDCTSTLKAPLNNGLRIANSYTINDSAKTISLVNDKFLYSSSDSTLNYNNKSYPYDYLSTITTVPKWTFLKSDFNYSTSSVDYSDTKYSQAAYGFRISEITVNPIEIRCTAEIYNITARLMEFINSTKVYSTNSSEYLSSSRTDLGSNFYLDWYSSESGTQYFYKRI